MRLDKVLDKLADKLDKLADKLDKVADKLDKLADKLDKVADKLDKVADKLDKLADKLDKLADKLSVNPENLLYLYFSNSLSFSICGIIIFSAAPVTHPVTTAEMTSTGRYAR